ncbi:14607_t:CDS:2, partial [Racocetra fulgida]
QLTSVDDKLGPHSVIMGVTVIQKYKITHICATPSIIIELVNNPEAQKFDLSSVDRIICTAARLEYKIERKFYEMFKILILQAYGSSGVLTPHMKAKILSEDGRELGYNELGELWVEGPNIMKARKATDAVFDKDGFFCSGDIASVDEQDAVVLGYYSEEEATEIPIAYVVIKNGYEQSQSLAREIQFFVDEKVAPHKKLRGGILLIDKIPKNL